MCLFENISSIITFSVYFIQTFNFFFKYIVVLISFFYKFAEITFFKGMKVMRRIRIYIFVFAVFLICQTGKAKDLLQPYLQFVSRDTVCLMVESDKKDTLFVKYGQGLGYDILVKTAFYKEVDYRRAKFYIHRIFLTGLKPSMEYHYQLLQTKGQPIEGTFKTPPDTSSILRFAVIADTQANPEIHTNIAKRLNKINPHFVVYAGDLTENGSYSEWMKEFFNKDVSELHARIPFFAALGNHDAYSNDFKAFLQPPRNGDGETYGSFDVGKVHFLILNTEQSLKKGSPQYVFAENDLKNAKPRWKVVIQHRPVYSPRSSDKQKDFEIICDSVFVPNRVDFVVAGHVHFYQRSIIKGIQHLILGGGGGNLVNVKEMKGSVMTKSQFHFAVFEVDEQYVFVKIYDTRGELIDSFEVTQYF